MPRANGRATCLAHEVEVLFDAAFKHEMVNMNEAVCMLETHGRLCCIWCTRHVIVLLYHAPTTFLFTG